VQTVGILLGVFSGLVGALIFWGGFAEQARANKEFEARLKQG
jgi:hypothetical protein